MCAICDYLDAGLEPCALIGASFDAWHLCEAHRRALLDVEPSYEQMEVPLVSKDVNTQ